MRGEEQHTSAVLGDCYELARFCKPNAEFKKDLALVFGTESTKRDTSKTSPGVGTGTFRGKRDLFTEKNETAKRWAYMFPVFKESERERSARRDNEHGARAFLRFCSKFTVADDISTFGEAKLISVLKKAGADYKSAKGDIRTLRIMAYSTAHRAPADVTTTNTTADEINLRSNYIAVLNATCTAIKAAKEQWTEGRNFEVYLERLPIIKGAVSSITIFERMSRYGYDVEV